MKRESEGRKAGRGYKEELEGQKGGREEGRKDRFVPLTF